MNSLDDICLTFHEKIVQKLKEIDPNMVCHKCSKHAITLFAQEFGSEAEYMLAYDLNDIIDKLKRPVEENNGYIFRMYFHIKLPSNKMVEPFKYHLKQKGFSHDDLSDDFLMLMPSYKEFTGDKHNGILLSHSFNVVKTKSKILVCHSWQEKVEYNCFREFTNGEFNEEFEIWIMQLNNIILNLCLGKINEQIDKIKDLFDIKFIPFFNEDQTFIDIFEGKILELLATLDECRYIKST